MKQAIELQDVGDKLLLKDIEEDNILLLLQLREIQKELEAHCLSNLESKQRVKTRLMPIDALWTESELLGIFAENQRLRDLINTQREIDRIKYKNMLSVKLGDLLIDSFDNPKILPYLPGKLIKIWWQNIKKTPSKYFGGKNFSDVIVAYQEGGMASVETLLAKCSSATYTIKADAYTALARDLIDDSPTQAIEAARRAYALDPKNYRLKWLAFRLYEIGNIIEADILLDTLPDHVSFSDSEKNRAGNIHLEARSIRESNVRQTNVISFQKEKGGRAQNIKSLNINDCLHARAKLNSPKLTNEHTLLANSFLGLFNNYENKGWTAVITLWKRSDYLEEQLNAVLNQSIPPEYVILLQNESHFIIDESILKNPKIKHIKSDINSLYLRWIIGYLENTKYICVFDDDVIPGTDWIKTCVLVSDKYNALVGPSGRRARPDEVPAWETVETYYKNDDAICDWVCNSYFFQTSWIKYIIQANRFQGYQKTFDDIQLAITLKALAGIRCVVPLQKKNNQAVNGHLKRKYGHDEHALWKRQSSEHMLKRSNFIKAIDEIGVRWCDEK